MTKHHIKDTHLESDNCLDSILNCSPLFISCVTLGDSKQINAIIMFFIVTVILQGDTLTPFKLIILRDYLLGTSKDLMKKWFHSKKKARS